mgnify:FL=1
MSTGQHSRRQRVDERRTDPDERAAVKARIAIAYVVSVFALIFLATFIAGTA